MKTEINEITINGIQYVEKGSQVQSVLEWTGEKTIQSRMIGKPVIVRDRNEGINIGRVVLADETGVELKDARRLYYHEPANKKLSWYEGVAMSGLSENSKVSGTVSTKTIISNNYSMTATTEEIYKSVLGCVPNVQS